MPDIFFDKEKEHEPKAPHLPAQPAVHVPAAPAPTMHQPIHPASDAVQSTSKLLHSKEHDMGLLAALCIRPKGIHFANQEPDEVVILFLRRHFITNIPWILSTIILILIPPLLFTMMQLLSLTFGTFPLGLVVILTGFYYLIVMSYAFSKFVSWFYNIGVVTQKRLVDLDTSNILTHNTAAATFKELVDIKFTQKGFWESFFDYGDIHIQTEAIRANFEFLAAPKPTKVSDIISDLRVTTEGGKH